MTSELKFICPECGGIELEVVQQNAQVTQKLEVYRSGNDVWDEWQDVPDIAGDDIWTERIQCASCGKVLPLHYGDGDEMDQLHEYLLEQAYNQVIDRTPKEVGDIAAAITRLEFAAVAASRSAVDRATREMNKEAEELDKARKELYRLIGGCDLMLSDEGEDEQQ